LDLPGGDLVGPAHRRITGPLARVVVGGGLELDAKSRFAQRSAVGVEPCDVVPVMRVGVAQFVDVLAQAAGWLHQRQDSAWAEHTVRFDEQRGEVLDVMDELLHQNEIERTWTEGNEARIGDEAALDVRVVVDRTDGERIRLEVTEPDVVAGFSEEPAAPAGAAAKVDGAWPTMSGRHVLRRAVYEVDRHRGAPPQEVPVAIGVDGSPLPFVLFSHRRLDHCLVVPRVAHENEARTAWVEPLGGL